MMKFLHAENVAPVVLLVGSLATVAPAALAAAPAGPWQTRMAIGRACRADYEKFCHEVEPGGGRLLACLNQHGRALSAPCHDALKKAGKLVPPAPAKSVP